MSDAESEPASEPDRGFELEPESDEAPPAPERFAPAPVPTPSVPVDPAGRVPRDEPDTRTVAERAGTAVEATPDALPPPPDWPAEAMAFPLRTPGPMFFAGVGGAFVVADLLGAVSYLAFPMRVLIVLFWVCALRAQAAVIGQSAAGKDVPRGWMDALQLDMSELSVLARFVVLYAAAFVLPNLLAAFLEQPGFVWVAVLLSPYLAVAALGWALGDPSLKWPWKALGWLARRPLAFVVGALGWWALWYGQIWIDETTLPARVVVSPVARGAALYLLLVSARALGVAGRSWTPWGFQEAEQRAD